MKKILLGITILLMFSLEVLAKEFTLTSPDKNMVVEVSINNNITWTVKYKKDRIIEKAVIGMDLTSAKIGYMPELVKKDTKLIDEIIKPVVPNKNSIIKDRCNELTLSFEDEYQLVFRVYDDGVAYRFKYLKNESTDVINETMDISFSDNTISFFPEEETMYSHNERLYLKKDLSSIASSEFCSLPVLFKTENGINVLFTETALHNYPCMFIKGSSNNSIHTQFPKYVLAAIPDTNSSPDRNQIITKEANYIAKVEGEKEFPWRVFIISDDDKALVESNLTFQLANPVGIESTDWIKPGKVAWDWYNANNIYGVDFESGINNETYKYYIDFASENGIEYVILDEGWTKSTTEIMDCNPDIDVEELIRYGNKNGVGIILWVLWKPLNDNMAAILEKYKSWGAKGIKIDFMQRSDQYMVNSYETIAKECARLKLLVDFHGAFKPSGLRRVYPNIINYEGVKGSENNKWSAAITPEHNVTIPFIRMAAGPMDYTPGCMNNASLKNHIISHFRPMSLGTRAHQIAMYVVYEAPLQMLCENPSTYKKEQESVDFIVQIPTTWDETKMLEGKVSDYIIVARRKGEKWYIGGMTDWSSRDFKLDLDFLGNGNYSMEVYKDGINADKFAEDYSKDLMDVNANSTIEIKMAPGGGWAAIISRK